ncbi:MAG: hypothetical protein QXX12_02590 [Nanopusillaceae archaeon]
MKKSVVCLGLGGILIGSVVSNGWAGSLVHMDKNTGKDGTKDSIKIEVFYEPVYFKWTEKENDIKLLTEKGWLNKGKIGIKIGTHYYVKPSFTIYGGDIKYDGGSWDGEKVKSRTNYSGYEVALAGGVEKKIGKTTIDAYIKTGVERWKRSIESNLSEEDTLVIGYGEKWKMWYWQVGIAPYYESSNNISLFGNLYVKRPFKVKNEVEIFDVEVEPGKKWNYGAEIGVEIKNMIKQKVNGKIAFFYEEEKFGKSDLKYSNVIDLYLYQPESKRQQYGIKLGINF